MLRILIILISVLETTHCISVDYYLGVKESDPVDPAIENDTQTSSLLTKLSRKQMNLSGTVVTMSFKEMAEYYDDTKPLPIEVENINRSENSFDFDSKTEFGYDTKELLQSNISIPRELKLLHQAFAFNDEVTRLKTQPLLRLKGAKKTMKPFTPKTFAIQKETSEDEKIPIDFYNLAPAAANEDGDTQFHMTAKNIWYVQENGICWKLPILYGEQGRALGPTDVFLMYRGILKNVIDRSATTPLASRPLYIPVDQTTNKWCASGPCYGDHTLCLYSAKTYSKLCLPGYKVSTPTIMEQIALVNTINSMRNKVANGKATTYAHLYPAADMRQVIYDFDLEEMARAWLHQCLPGPSACSALDGAYVSQLECTKVAKYCCVASYKNERASKCIPLMECYVEPIRGCVHVWYGKAGKMLTPTDVECGHVTPYTYPTVQMLWAETQKVGCAYGVGPEGDIRVVCNFSPAAPFYIDTHYYCGFIAHTNVMEHFSENITDKEFLESLGIFLSPAKQGVNVKLDDRSHVVNYSLRNTNTDLLAKIYRTKWMREVLHNKTNNTLGFVASLVTRYSFVEEGGSQCDLDEPIYQKGEPGSKCVEKSRRFHGLCYDYRDPTPGYRLVAVLAPVALFSLILYDLFSGVVRQTSN